MQSSIMSLTLLARIRTLRTTCTGRKYLLTLRLDPCNRTVPVREILFFSPDFSSAGYTSEESDMRALVIMDRFDVLAERSPPGQDECVEYPLLRSVNDVLDMSLQIIQGISFMHRCGIAHRDLYQNNFVCENGLASRRLYVIDFQFSAYFPKPWLSPPLVPPGGGMNEPEAWTSSAPYDPFLADVYCLGNVIRMITESREIAPSFTGGTHQAVEDHDGPVAGGAPDDGGSRGLNACHHQSLAFLQEAHTE